MNEQLILEGHRLKFPLEDMESLRELRAGDIVRIDGTIIALRDATLIRIFDEEIAPPVDLTGAACFHAAPVTQKLNSSYKLVSIGATTSIRMNRFTEPLLKQYGVKAVIGKGGLLKDSVEALQKYGACYFSAVGGAAALSTLQIKEIEKVYWEDLDPECLWKLRVSDFGPLIVAIDSFGHSLFEDIAKNANNKLNEIFSVNYKQD